jgi:putative ABC transport system permease protein
VTPRTPRLLVWLLRAFPPEFREAYGVDMAATFADRRAAARRQGRRAVAALWVRTVASVLVHGLAERRRSSFRHPGDSRLSVARLIQWAARRLNRSRGFTLAGFLTLTVGLGCATAVFSIVNAILLRPLPYPQAERLVSVSHTLQVHGSLRVDQSDASLLFFERHHPVFTQFGGYQTVAAALGPVPGGDAERVAAARVTSGVFEALRVSPLRGRLFTAADDEPGAAPVVILAERLWGRLGGDSGVANHRIVINDESREVVGVFSNDVRFPSPETELWLPLSLNPAHTDSASFDYQAVARLRDGVSIEHAAADLQALLLHLPDEIPGRLTRAAIEATHMRVSVRPLAAVMIEGLATPLWLVLGAAGFVLAAACANVASLFLVRAESRRKIFAIQRVLGASPRTVLLEFLSEVLVLAGLAGLCGLGIAAAAIRALRSASIAIDIPRLTEATIDPVVVGMAALATACTILLVGAFAAWRSRTSESGGLAALHPGPTAGPALHLARYTLVALQVALAMVLVVGSGLMARSLWQLRRIPPGFEATGALTFRLALPPSVYPGADEAVRFFDQVLEGVSRVPGVQAAGAASKLPLEDRAQTNTAAFVESQPMSPGALPHLYPVTYLTPEYFGAMRIPIVEGQTFMPFDPPHVHLEAVVSRAFAAQYWPDQSAIGQRVRILVNGPWYTVVGVAANVRDTALDQPADSMIYCPLLPPAGDQRWMPRDLAVVVRTSGDPGAAAADIRSVIRRLDPSVPLYHTQILSDLVAHASARRALVLRLLSIASAMTLVLGAIGLYGAMAYVVSLRTREIGIRMALGERAAAVGWLVVRQGMLVAMLGIGVGLGGALGLARGLREWLIDVAPSDPLVLLLSGALVLALTVAASWIPSRRAAAINPAITLRGE